MSRFLEIIFTLLVLTLGLLLGLGFYLEPLGALLHPLLSLYLLSLEIFFRLAETNELILIVSGVVLALGLWWRFLCRLAARLYAPAGAVARALLGGFLALLALLALVYVVAFAAITQPLHLGLSLVAASVAAWLTRRAMPDPRGAHREPAAAGITLEQVPLSVLASFLLIYFLLGMIQGHLATPLVHGLSAAMAGMSARQPLLYNALAVVLLGLPLLPWLPRVVAALPARRRRLLWALPALLLLALLPGRAAVHAAGVVWAVILAVALARAGFYPRLLHPDPRQLLVRLMLPALLGLNASAVHYLGTMWDCSAGARPHPAVRRVSSEAGAFYLASTADGRQLLASLREPRRVVSVDPVRAVTRTLLRLSAGQGTGHFMSWEEPENLLRLTGDRFLLLRAVSDDQERNAVVVIDRRGTFLQYLQRPRAGVSDMVSDGQGRVYLSTEFLGKVFVLDARTLALIQTIDWRGAETNRVLVTPDRRLMFSLGLWSDPMLRVMELASQRQVAALDVGTLSWDMAHDPRTGRLFVPKFMTGQVLVIETGDNGRRLALKQRWAAGFGARAVRLDRTLRLLYVGAMYAGTVTVLDADSGRLRLRLRLGGHIKSLHVEPKTQKAYVGCDCGIFEIDGRKL